MIDLYYWPTPNGWKTSIMLEEYGLPYRLVPVNIGKGEPFSPEFLAISPNNRMPAIVDHAPSGGGDEAVAAIFESGTILLYLAEKSGRFLATDLRQRYQTLQWQMGGLGPMAGQNGHFLLYAPEKIPYAIERYGKEVDRLYSVLDAQLARTGAYVAGADHSIAGVARPDIKEQIKANTDGAIRRGAFGSPTFFVGDDMYFGNDRLPLLRSVVLRARPAAARQGQ